MIAVEPAPHEYEGHYFYDELQLWLAADRITSDHDGAFETSFTTGNEKWDVTLSYQESGLVPPESGVTPGGTEIQHDTIREYRLNMVRDDDVGEKKVKCHIAPRWKGLQAETKDGDMTDAAKAAWPAGDGSNVEINSSNVDYDRVQTLLQKGAAAVNINSYHVSEDRRREEFSHVNDAAMYVRLDKTQSGPIHGREGPLARLGHLLESDRTGYRKVVQDDTKKAGYYHTVTLGPMRVKNAWTDHHIPREVKHYYKRNPDYYDGDYHLDHPKLEVAYQRSRWDESLGIEDHDEIRRQLTETIYSILDAADMDIHPDDGAFLSDKYFIPSPTEISTFPRLDLARIESDQRNVVVRQLADGLSPVEWGSVKTLVSDGGEVSPADIADEHGFHPDSVRRALRRISDMVERDHGSVALRSHYVAEQVAEAVDAAKESVSRAVNAASHALENAERDRIDKRTDELIAFCQSHGISINEREKRLVLKMGHIASSDEWTTLLTRLKDIWTAAGRDPQKLRDASTEYFNMTTEKPTFRPATQAFTNPI
ncbi:ORF9 [Halorubrum pleomorphic virus 10]|uniref:ORF9 n=1 Tax=Halorubrum pleomorphic virus 10 TaxID=2507576 RepID=A0A410N6N8_9VIRU|nr:transcriptional regulator [Halorubrum pleomorphic virus 10]QAS68831.1 ORF9 [Halorubrum pleomorphic virus 10]